MLNGSSARWGCLMHDRVWAKIKRGAGCWNWTGSKDSSGYGTMQVPGTRKTASAHRYVYQSLVGEIPAGMCIDHICRNHACVNVEHLRVVSRRTNNIENSNGASAINIRKTHCKHGHPFDTANTYVDSRGRRGCRACNRLAVGRYKRKGKVEP